MKDHDIHADKALLNSMLDVRGGDIIWGSSPGAIQRTHVADKQRATKVLAKRIRSGTVKRSSGLYPEFTEV